MKIEIRVSRANAQRGFASVHVVIDENSSFTISNVSVWDDAGKPKITMPISQMGAQKRPNITVQGELKQVLTKALWETFLIARSDTAGRAESEWEL